MKKLISIILAFVLAFACCAALGGCGKAADSKEAFITSRNYYSDLFDTLAAPVADIDTAALADAQAAGMTGKLSFSLEGLSALQNMISSFLPEGFPVISDCAFDVDFVTDGVAASGDVMLTLLGETLKAAFSSDGENVALSLPDLLSRAVVFGPGELGAFGYNIESNYSGYDYDYDESGYAGDDDLDDLDDFDDLDDYYEDYGILDLDEAAYDAEYDFGENGKYFAENGDLYVDYDGDGRLDDAFAAGKFDEETIDYVIKITRDTLGDDFGYFPTDFDLLGADSIPLLRRFVDLFLENLSESCYSSGKETFRTADGEAELDCLTLSADGGELLDAYKKSLTALADDALIGETYGENADSVRELLRSSASECDEPEYVAEAAECALSWTRFTRNDAIIGDRLYVSAPDAEYTLEAGLDEGYNTTLAFLKLTDEKQGVDLLDAESSVGSKKGELSVSFYANGSTYSFKISGKTKEENGVKTTDAKIKLGLGDISFDLFNLKTTVRAFDENAVDFDFELSSDIMKLLSGGSGFGVKLAVTARRDANAAPDAIDVTGAYTFEDTLGEEFNEEFESNFKEKFPNIYALLQSRAGAEEPSTAE